MLISTSRKPSQKTRTFCKNLSHAFGYDYTNRGKSSLRDLLVKAKQLGHDGLVLVYQIKGNPSKLTFYDLESNEKLALLVSVNTTSERLHIKPEELKIRSTVRELDILAEVLGIEVTTEPQDSNYIRISYADYDDESNFAIIYFINKKGEQIDFRINVKKIVNNN
ncbi:MAG: ribonucleotide-diphosphate reductase subunit beta [Methanobrevibacter sp.]|nr:ribonucleotide-diphosphate reductase subunit beta [Methanobrevibacter sp.]